VASTAALLVDAFGRIRETVHRAVDGLAVDELTYRVDPDANSIAWLVWHLTRVQDDHVSEVADVDQAWLAGGWCDRFALPFDRHAHGYGQSSDEVAAVRADAQLLLGYHDAVHEQSVGYLKLLTDADLDRIVDTSWDPPVSLAVRLISVINDDMQHAGQAAFVRGIVTRRRAG
jgi:uncharacterized damage-inducible protein DinB